MKKYIGLFLIILLLIFCFYIYKTSTYTYLTAKFEELRPIHGNIPIYYKGIVIGKAKEKIHSKDMQHTLMGLSLHKKSLLLPENTTILLKKEIKNKKEKDFLELIYPKNPSSIMLSNGSTIKGIATVDIATFISNQHPDELQEIKDNLLKSSQNLEEAIGAIASLFSTIEEMVNENRKNIYNSSKNLKNTTNNISKLTKKIDNSINQEDLNKANSNITKTLNNINSVSDNAILTLKKTNCILNNINSITCGIKKTMSKSFSTIRLFFGKTIN